MRRPRCSCAGCFLASVIAFAVLTVGGVVLVEVSEWLRQREQRARGERERWYGYYQRGDYDKALELLNERLSHRPNDADALESRGRVYEGLGHYDAALADYDEAIRCDPSSAYPHYHKARLLLEQKKGDEAITEAMEAVRLRPGWDAAYEVRGLAHLSRKDYEGAVEDFTQAIRLQPRSADLYRARGNAFFFRTDYGSALADYRQAMLVNPESPAPYKCAAWLLAVCPDEKFRDGKQALEYAQLYCELRNWDDPEAFDVLAAAYAEFGAFALAVKWEERALEFPEFDDAAGAEARKRLELYKQECPFRQE